MLIRFILGALLLGACGGSSSTRTLGEPFAAGGDPSRVQLLLDLELNVARQPQFGGPTPDRVRLTLSGTEGANGAFTAAVSAYDFQSEPVLVSGVRNSRSLELQAFTVPLKRGLVLSVEAAVVGSGNMATVRGSLSTFQGDVGDSVATTGLLTVSEDVVGSSLVAGSARGAQQFPFEPLEVLAQEPLAPAALARVLALKVGDAVVQATLTPEREVAGRAQRFTLAPVDFPAEGAQLEVEAPGAADPGGASVVFSSPKAGRVAQVEAASAVVGGVTRSDGVLGVLTSAPSAPLAEQGGLRLNPGTLVAASLLVPQTATTLRFALRRGSPDTSDALASPPPPNPSALAMLFTAPGVSTEVNLTLSALTACAAEANAARCSEWSTQSVDVSALRGKRAYLKLEVPPNQFFSPERDFYWVKDVRLE